MIHILLTGTILKGRYCILDAIGKGGQGSLYLARDIELGVCRAVKEIPLSGKREAKLLRLLAHPAMPAMLDYVEKTEYCYLVMEYIQGRSLGELLEEGRVFTKAEILDLAMASADVLDYLHTRKPPVYYGDLKPDNLMLSESGKLYLVDYGSAVFGYPHKGQAFYGTKGFAAPEQLEGRVNAQSDIYALGKTIYCLMGKKRGRLLLSCPGLIPVLLRCCQPRETLRYRGVREVYQELEKLRLRKSAFSLPWKVLAGSALLILGCILGLKWTGIGKPDFEEALTQVTDRYYQEAFLEGNQKEQQAVCHLVEEELKRLAKIFKEDGEQERILLLQAQNSEIMENWDEAELCYQQLLLYHEDYPKGYSGYGMYLWRRKRPEESAGLWDTFQEKRREYVWEKEPEWRVWEATINEWKRDGEEAVS